jgi:hypothetical protein
MPVRRNPRLIVFTVVAVLAGLLYGYAATLLPVPWTDIPVTHSGIAPADQRWELALMAASTGVVLAGMLLSASWRPLTRPVLMQAVAVGVVLDVSLEVPVRGPAYLGLALPASIAVAAYPRLRSLSDVRPKQRLRLPFVVFGVLTGTMLLVRVVFVVGQPTDWIDDAAHTVMVAVAALFAVSGRPGWRIVSALVGAALCYLGIVAVTLPESRGWGPIWGVLACAAGLAYAAAAAWPAIVTGDKAPVGGAGVAPRRQPAPLDVPGRQRGWDRSIMSHRTVRTALLLAGVIVVVGLVAAVGVEPATAVAGGKIP